MLDIPGTCVALDSEEAEEVKEKNEQYQEVKCDLVTCYHLVKFTVPFFRKYTGISTGQIVFKFVRKQM